MVPNTIDNINTDNTRLYILNNEPIEEKLHVVSVISNPCNYKIRYELAKEFIKRMNEEPNIILYIVELVYEDQPFILTDETNKTHLQLRGKIPLWHKENMINMGIKKLLPSDWKSVAWIDADIEFDNPNWAIDSLKILNNGNDFIQLFTNCVDMDYNKQIMNLFTGFGYQYSKNFKKGTGVNYWHPGFAWACNRETYEKVGGIFEIGILGSGDNVMCHTFINSAEKTLKAGMSLDYKNYISLYQEKFKGVKLGYVPGIIRHYFHGKKVNRKYFEREEILIQFQYSPYLHITHDENGLIIPTDECPQGFLDEILNYFKNRNEDEMVLEQKNNQQVNQSDPKKQSEPKKEIDPKKNIETKKDIKVVNTEKEKELLNVLNVKSTDVFTLEYKINYIYNYMLKNKQKI
jgi:hypothetical protein